MGEGITILVVEDEEFIRSLLQEFLGSRGMKVILASDGEEALEVFASRKDEIDLVILDLVLPGMKGEEVLAAMKSLDPGVRVLVTTGFGEDERLERMRAMGIKGVLNKPFHFPSLVKNIETALDESS